MNIEYFFHHNPVFIGKDFAEYLLKQGFENNYAQVGAIKYYAKIGRIISVRRGCYVVITHGENADTFSVDYYLLASKLTDDSILAYHAALELHGIANSIFYCFTCLSHHHSRQFIFREGVFKVTAFPKKLSKKHQEEFGVISINRAGLNIKVTGLARTIVDVLDRADLAGGWEEVWRSLEAVTVFDVQEAVDYALLLGNATAIAKLGFYLEQRPKLLAIDEKYIDRLSKHIPLSPHYINRKSKHQTRFFKKWNLIVPVEIVNRAWEESLDADI